MKKIVLISLVAGYLVLWPMLLHMASAQTSATMSYNRTNNSTVTLDANGRFTIAVQVNTGGNDSGGFDSTLTYNSTQITYVSNSYASFYNGTSVSPLNTVNGASSTLKLGRASADPVNSPANSSSATVVSTATFQVVSGVTSSTLGWNYSSGSTSDNTNVWTPNATADMLASAPAAVTLNFAAYVPSPDITLLNPTSGTTAGGTPVIISGTNFGSTQGSVTIGGLTATITTWSSVGNSIAVTTPAHSAGAVYAIVTTSGGQSTSATDPQAQYTYTAPPSTTPDITLLNPTSGTTAGGTPVTISGTNFGTAQGTVSFGGTSATSITSWGNTSIVAVSPARSAGAIYVIVTTSGSQSTSATDPQAQYTYIAPGSTNPNIASISPNQGSENGGTPVTLTGTNFGSTEGTVYIAGNAVSASLVTWGSTSINFSTPAYSVSSNTPVNVYIVTSGGLTSNTVQYTYLNEGGGTVAMNISYLSPSSGLADQAVTVTIYGSGFGSSQGTVTFGQYGANISSWSDTQIVVTAPILGSISSNVTYPVTVTRPDGVNASSSYTYLAPASTGGGDTTPDTGLPITAWVGLITMNGGLALVAKRKFFA